MSTGRELSVEKASNGIKNDLRAFGGVDQVLDDIHSHGGGVGEESRGDVERDAVEKIQ